MALGPTRPVLSHKHSETWKVSMSLPKGHSASTSGFQEAISADLAQLPMCWPPHKDQQTNTKTKMTRQGKKQGVIITCVEVQPQGFQVRSSLFLRVPKEHLPLLTPSLPKQGASYPHFFLK